MTMMKFAQVLGFCFFGLALAGCGGNSDGQGGRKRPVDEATAQGMLLFGNGADPKSLDPHVATGVPEHNIISALLEGLVGENPKDLSPVPGVAERWDVSEDGRVYTFHFRADAVWSNGDPVTADDFHFSYKRMLSPDLGSEYAYMLHVLENAKAYNEGTLDDFSKVGVKVIDPKTLQLKLNNRLPYFLGMLNHYAWFPVNPKAVLDNGTIDQRDNQWQKPGAFVSNGPFTLKTWEHNKAVEVAKSTNYWDAANVKLNGIRFVSYEGEQAGELLFRAGKLHRSDVPLHLIPKYRTENPDLIRFDDYLGVYYYTFNVTKPPFDNLLVREAFSLAIDRNVICTSILKSGEKPALFFTPPDTNGYTSSAQLSEDVERARKKLAEAGYPAGKGFPKVALLYNTSEAHKQVATAIQSMWKERLGVEIEMENKEWNSYLTSRSTGNFSVCRAGWIADYLDPNSFLDLFIAASGNNHSGWTDPGYDALIEQAAAASDPEARYKIFQTAEKQLLEAMPVLPIYHYKSKCLLSPDVKGWHGNYLDHHPYKALQLESASGADA